MTIDVAAPAALEDLAGRMWEAVVRGDESAATAMVRRALDGGLDPESVLLDVIAPIQGRVGAEWADNRIGVAQEHAATAINERALAAVAQHPIQALHQFF